MVARHWTTNDRAGILGRSATVPEIVGGRFGTKEAGRRRPFPGVRYPSIPSRVVVIARATNGMKAFTEPADVLLWGSRLRECRWGPE